MSIAIRLAVLSICMGLYLVWAFRGIENNPLEAIPDLLGFIGAFLILTAIAVPVYRLRARDGNVAQFAFRCWLVTAGLVALGLIVRYARDTAAGGFFRNNVLVGTLGLIVVVAVLNYLLVRATAYLAPKRR